MRGEAKGCVFHVKYLTIANANVEIVEFNNERVLTTEQLAEVYECDTTNIKKNFNANKDRFIEGKHSSSWKVRIYGRSRTK